MKNDHRIAVTKKMITDAFLVAVKSKPISEITVKELCESAHINRATFYVHYENIFDLADSVRQEFAEKIITAVTEFKNEDSLNDMLVSVCLCIAENPDYCETVFGRYADSDFINTVVELLRGKFLSLWRECDGADKADLDLTYTFIANGGVAVLSSWVQSGMKQSPEYIAAFIERNVKIEGFENAIDINSFLSEEIV